MIIIIIKLQICGKRFCEIIVTRTFFAQQLGKTKISTGQSDIARRTALKTAINRRGEFFNQQFSIFPVQARVGNRLTVNQRLAANDFLRTFTQETLRHDPGNCRRTVANLLAHVITNVQLTTMLLLAIAVAKIDHQMLRQENSCRVSQAAAISSA
jgi:hypothetical protein